MFARVAAELDVARGARGCSPLWRSGGARRGLALGGMRRGATPRGWDRTTLPATECSDDAARLQNRGCASLSTANFGRRGRLIREKIMGRGMRGLAPTVAVHSSFQRAGVLPLLHQPARQQSRRILFQPGIQQLRDLFSEIGGVVQAREFITTQGIARGREQELPRRLSFVMHGDLQSKGATAPVGGAGEGVATVYLSCANMIRGPGENIPVSLSISI
jgi:hypothetical protein